MRARYAFGARVRIDPDRPGIDLDPSTVEVTLYREADEPGTDGWLFFRDHLWRGEVADADHARRLAAEWVGEPVEAVDFRALHADPEYFDALKAEIGRDLEPFNADDVAEVVSKYLGSSVVVREDVRAGGCEDR